MKMKYEVIDTANREGVGRFFLRTFGKVKRGLGPLWAYMGAVTVFGTYVVYHQFMKPEVYLNRANSVGPLEWSRAKSYFNRRARVGFDSAENWPLPPELGVLDEMEEMEKKLR